VLTIGVVAYNNPEETLAFAQHLTTLTSVAYQLRIWDNSEDGQVMRTMRDHPELAVCVGGEGNLGFGAGHQPALRTVNGRVLPDQQCRCGVHTVVHPRR
jgi:FPC/CPF motif-containing protein YcgG